MRVLPIIKTRTKCILFIIVALIASAALLNVFVKFFISNLNPLSGSQCSGVLEHHHNNTFTKISFVFRFYDNRNADITLSGTTKEKDKWNVYRKINFRYQYVSDGSFTMTDVKNISYANDNVSNDYFRSNIVDFPERGGRVTIRKFKNTYIIYNTYSPVLVCEKKSITG